MYSRRILVDIDTIFDTRLGLVLDKFPSKYGNIDMELYRKRISEVTFGLIGIDDWEGHWAARNTDCLKQAMPTELLYGELRRVLMGEVASHEMSAPTDMPELTFNLYPYVLSIEETTAMRDMLKEEFVGFEVKVGRWCENGLSPATLRSSWDTWFTYDFYRWLNHNAAKLKTRIPNFVLYRPAILSADMTEDAVTLIKRDNINPFTESKRFLAEYLTVEALDAGLFSVAREYTNPRAASDDLPT